MSEDSNPIIERQIIVVDDDIVNLKLVSSVLNWEKCKVFTTTSGEEALDLINSVDPHLMILDVMMPGLNGFQTLSKIRERQKYVSVIFLSGNKKIEDIVKGLSAGADDYITKPFHPSELQARVKAQLRNCDMKNQLITVNKHLSQLVVTDEITGLFNMRTLYDKLDVEVERARRFKRLIGVIMLDIDFFKLVNDNHDHLFGSFVLSELGKIIKDNIRQTDFAARYGGDEFLIVLTDTNQVGAHLFCERLRERVAAVTFKSGKDQMNITVSLGYSIFDGTGSLVSGKELVRTADRALYKSKNAGRDCVSYFAIDEHSKTPAHQLLKK
ncbi:MAG: diguanylate cyclase [Pseudomonadota bacterium]|nr:diguanylate cyclase [Pseudomonadota bacterium]